VRLNGKRAVGAQFEDPPKKMSRWKRRCDRGRTLSRTCAVAEDENERQQSQDKFYTMERMPAVAGK
jgi:hypothetical protein